jgi:hypothetical protein
LRETSYLFALRQNGQDRSNVALQHAGSAEEGEVVLRLTVFDGRNPAVKGYPLPDVALAPGGFVQRDGILQANGIAEGYVKVERITGRAPYYAYGVINDNANSDGSFVQPVLERDLRGNSGLIVPVAVENDRFTTELVITNSSEESRGIELEYAASNVAPGIRRSLLLPPRSQRVIDGIVNDIRQNKDLGSPEIPTDANYAGALYIRPVPLKYQIASTLEGVHIGARTSTGGGGGRYGLFYSAIAFGKATQSSAWLYGLQQNSENRTNLALVNTGETDARENVYRIELFDGDTGQKVNTVNELHLPATLWMQLDTVLSRFAPGTKQGYAKVTRVSGANPFITYSVINDGGNPGERSGDGAFVASTP